MVVRFDRIEVNLLSRQLSVGGCDVCLTPKQFEVFQYLITIPNVAVPHKKMGLSPGVRQTVKTLLTVRWNCIVLRKPFPARWAPAGEAAAGSAGAQPAKE